MRLRRGQREAGNLHKIEMRPVRFGGDPAGAAELQTPAGRLFFLLHELREDRIVTAPLPQSRKATFAIWRVVLSVFIQTWCQPCSVIVAWSR